MNFGVGSIVWVRQRNGSWWPGQMLDTDDLSASHLTSPRSGTPVKLLGREDASMDCYNLEKSKCVKAFRCGEFDDCIEKSESVEGMPLKKREKYARREDAILHALELKRQLLKKQAKLGMASDRMRCRSSNTLRKGVVTLPTETVGNDNEKHANLKSYMSGENEIASGPFPLELARDGNQLSGEVDISEEIPWMRDLQDFGFKIAPLIGKLSSPVNPNVSQKLSVDEGAQTLPSSSLCIRSALQTNGKIRWTKKWPDERLRAGQVSCRAKRSRCFYFLAGSSDSLYYKESLTHVEMSSPQLGGEFPYRGSLVGESELTFMDDVESGSSETNSTDSDSDFSETELSMGVQMTILTCYMLGLCHTSAFLVSTV